MYDNSFLKPRPTKPSHNWNETIIRIISFSFLILCLMYIIILCFSAFSNIYLSRAPSIHLGNNPCLLLFSARLSQYEFNLIIHNNMYAFYNHCIAESLSVAFSLTNTHGLNCLVVCLMFFYAILGAFLF